MRGQLSTEKRLQISVTRLKQSVRHCHLKIKEQTILLKEKDKKIKELEAKLLDKESQRKELLSYLYKPGKKDEVALPRGKKPGAPVYHRLIPPDSAVTEEYTYTVRKCPICKGGVGDIVDTVVKYTEDIVLKPHPLVTKHTITRH